MADNAVTRFKTGVDALLLAPPIAAAVKNLIDPTAYNDMVQDYCNHLDKHLNAIIASDPDNTEQIARATLLKTATAKIRTDGIPHEVV